jgi:hypothetical protein
MLALAFFAPQQLGPRVPSALVLLFYCISLFIIIAQLFRNVPMNGIGLLVLIIATGQVGAAQPTTLNRDFGWERDTRNPDNALCYIVQVSPQDAAEMQRDGLENPSNMPPELVGRATRIVVRIGTALLPQSPSLEELRKEPLVNSRADVTAGLSGGRLSDVEPNGVVNVQQDRGSPPTLPNYSGQATTAAPRAGLNGQALPGSENPIDQAKELARGLPGFPNPAANASSSASGGNSPQLPGYPGTADRFGSSALDNNSTLPPAGQGNLGGSANSNKWPSAQTNLGGERSREDAARMADGGYPSNPGATNAGNYPNSGAGGSVPPGSGYGQGGYGAGGYDPRNPPSLDSVQMTGIPSQQTPSNTFGTYPGNQGPKFGLQPPGYNNAAGSGQLPPAGQGAGYGGGQYAPPNSQFVGGQGGFDSGTRIAAGNTGGNPGFSNPQPPPGGASAQGASGANAGAGARGASPSDGGNELASGPSRTKAAENILPVFFLLSLVVNFYLGMLIRKLLTRYRALLANMRGQGTPNAFSA